MKNAIPYSLVKIDKKEIPQSKLDIDCKVRSNLFAWNGQFSPQFVEVLLDKYANPTDIVFDPFLGSGTTLCESARKNLSAFGVELNVSAFYMAKTYEIINLDILKRHELLIELDSFIDEIKEDNRIVQTITDYIEKHGNTTESNILSTLIILMDIFNNEVSIKVLHKKWDVIKEIVTNLPYSTKKISAERGDARCITVEDNTASLLITSPPYINVFNYHQKYRRSVEALGYDVLKIARNEFGSNRKNRGNRLLTVIQYCIDMALSIAEARRVCKDNSRMIYVVGRESKVLGYSFCNSQLIYEIATEIFDLPLLLRQERVFKNRFGQMIYEDILNFSNDKSIIRSHDEIVTMARNIAIRMLQEKRNMYPESDNVQLLLDAINKSDKIKESEG